MKKRHAVLAAILPAVVLSSICLALPARAAVAPAPSPAATAPAPMVNPADRPDSPWQFSTRLFSRNIRRVCFQTGSESVVIPRVSGGGRANVGDAKSIANRQYDNGYVRQDAGTPMDGTTWCWGYSDSGQIRGDSIVFRAFDGYETSGSSGGNIPASWDKTDFSAPQLGVSLERIVKQYPSANAGMRLDLSHLSFSIERAFTGSQVIQSARYIEDSYALQGITPPPAPYSGNSSGPGPIIDNVPSSRSVKRQPAGKSTSLSSIRESLGVDLTSLSLGFSVHYPAGPLVLSASVGPSFHMVHARAEHLELPASASAERRQFSNTSDELLMGYFAEALAEIQVSSRFRLGAAGRYDSIGETANTVGPSRYSMDPSGWSVGLVANIGL